MSHQVIKNVFMSDTMNVATKFVQGREMTAKGAFSQGIMDQLERQELLGLYAQKAAADQRAVDKKAADARTATKRAVSEMDAYLSGK